MPSDDLAALKIDRTRRRPQGFPSRWLLGMALLVCAAWALPRISAWREVEVSTAPVVTMRGSIISPEKSGELTAAGYVVADRQSVLAFKGTGRLTRLNVAESQRVAKGEVIAEIDHHELDARIAQAEAARLQAAAETEHSRVLAAQAEAELEFAKRPVATIEAEIGEVKIRRTDAQRRLDLAKNVVANQAMPGTYVDDRQTEVTMAEAQIVTAELRKAEALQKIGIAEAQARAARAAVDVNIANEHAAAANVGVLKAELEDAYIYSPFDGVVTEKAAEVGEIVAPISIGGSMARGSIATIAEWSSLQAEVDVAESYISRVKPGQRAAITVDAFPDTVFPGRTLRILPRANRSKATVLVRVDFLKRDDGVLPEMGVRVRFLPDDAPPGAENGTVKPVFAIPFSAVQSEGNENAVWTVVGNQAFKQKVNTGNRKDDMIEIRDGLNSGDQVVIHNAGRLSQNGQKVRIVEEH